MSAPVRIQLRRTKGWRMPPNTVSVARPGKHGNPFTIGCNPREFSAALPLTCETVEQAVECFRYFAEAWQLITSGRWAKELEGKNLGCWCRLCERHAHGKPLDEDCPDCAPCHVDPLGKIANRDSGSRLCPRPRRRAWPEGRQSGPRRRASPKNPLDSTP